MMETLNLQQLSCHERQQNREASQDGWRKRLPGCITSLSSTSSRGGSAGQAAGWVAWEKLVSLAQLKLPPSALERLRMSACLGAIPDLPLSEKVKGSGTPVLNSLHIAARQRVAGRCPTTLDRTRRCGNPNLVAVSRWHRMREHGRFAIPQRLYRTRIGAGFHAVLCDKPCGKLNGRRTDRLNDGPSP